MIAEEPLRTIYEDLQVNDSLTIDPYNSHTSTGSDFKIQYEHISIDFMYVPSTISGW